MIYFSTTNSQQIKKDDKVPTTTENHLDTRSESEEENTKVVKTEDVDNQSAEIKIKKLKNKRKYWKTKFKKKESKWINNWNELNRQFGELTKDKNKIIIQEIKFLETWLEMYSEGEFRMLVCERDIFDRIKYLKTLVRPKTK